MPSCVITKFVCIAIITNVLFIFDTLGRSLGMCCSERDQSTKRGGKLSLCKQVMVGTGIEHSHNVVKKFWSGIYSFCVGLYSFFFAGAHCVILKKPVFW